MGGQAFASGLSAVLTPRMRPHVYRIMRDRCQEKLRELYVVVATPIEGPAKTSYGDIDLFVAWKRDEIFPISRPATSPRLAPKSQKDAISQILGAIRIRDVHPRAITLAIPWPTDIPHGDDAREGQQEASADQDNNEDEKPRCIQVDVRVCDTINNLEWLLFRNAHGDLWNVLGSTMRPYGLTLDEVGFHIRIPEIEHLDKKKSRILLSTNPGEILNFLGLRLASDGTPWTEPFASDEDLFEYVSTCWLFRVKYKVSESRERHEDAEGEEANDQEHLAMTGDKEALKANDRRRMHHRPLFKKWIEEWIPACRAASRFTTRPPTRDYVRERAFSRFPASRQLYETRRINFLHEEQNRQLGKGIIQNVLPSNLDPRLHGMCASALKQLIVKGRHASNYPGFAEITDADPCAGNILRGPDEFFDEQLVREWVERNWQGVMKAACGLDAQRARERVERQKKIKEREKRQRSASSASSEGEKAENKDGNNKQKKKTKVNGERKRESNDEASGAEKTGIPLGITG